MLQQINIRKTPFVMSLSACLSSLRQNIYFSCKLYFLPASFLIPDLMRSGTDSNIFEFANAPGFSLGFNKWNRKCQKYKELLYKKKGVTNQQYDEQTGNYNWNKRSYTTKLTRVATCRVTRRNALDARRRSKLFIPLRSMFERGMKT